MSTSPPLGPKNACQFKCGEGSFSTAVNKRLPGRSTSGKVYFPVVSGTECIAVGKVWGNHSCLWCFPRARKQGLKPKPEVAVTFKAHPCNHMGHSTTTSRTPPARDHAFTHLNLGAFHMQTTMYGNISSHVIKLEVLR